MSFSKRHYVMLVVCGHKSSSPLSLSTRLIHITNRVNDMLLLSVSRSIFTLAHERDMPRSSTSSTNCIRSQSESRSVKGACSFKWANQWKSRSTVHARILFADGRKYQCSHALTWTNKTRVSAREWTNDSLKRFVHSAIRHSQLCDIPPLCR